MSSIGVHKDVEALTLTVTASFGAPLERVWELWADPRQLERWWGPPTHPATVVEHDLRPGGRVAYFMTGPDGKRYHGWWRVTAVEPPGRLSFEDGFADVDGNTLDDMPTAAVSVALVEAAGVTTMTVTSQYSSRADMEKVLAMGVEEGIAAAMGQIPALLAA